MEYRKFFEEYKINFIKKKIFSEEHIVGCTENEIKTLQNDFQNKIPDAFKNYLKIFGKTFNIPIQNGFDISLKKMETNEKHFRANILDRSISDFELPNNAFIFATQDSDIAFFMLINDNENPEIYEFSSCSRKPEILFKTFT